MNALKGLPEFIAVVDRGTFTAAAKQLNVSVSHISRHIAELESRLATQLFIRTTRQMQLTESGTRLFSATEPLMEELIGIQDRLTRGSEMLEGSIRITLAGKLAEEQIVPLLTDFSLMHGGISLEIDVSARNVDLIAEGYHLAIRMGPLVSSSSLVAVRLVSVPMITLACQALTEKLGHISQPEDLPPVYCLPLVGRNWHFTNGKRQISIRPLGRLSTNSGNAAVSAALKGIGVIHVPAYYADEKVSTGELITLLPDWRSVESTTFYLVYPAGKHMPQRVRSLIDYLQSSMNMSMAT